MGEAQRPAAAAVSVRGRSRQSVPVHGAGCAAAPAAARRAVAAMSGRRGRRALLAALVCWTAAVQSVGAARYTAGTLRQYLQEVVVEALASHCTPTCAGAATAAAGSDYGCQCEQPAECAEGYVRCGGVCYRRLETAMAHAAAQKACTDDGGRLAVPRTADQHLCSRALALGAQVWLGITADRGTYGQFRGSDGAIVDSTGPFWDAGQPDRYTGEDPDGEDCVELFPNAGWHDRTCRHAARPLCQHD